MKRTPWQIPFGIILVLLSAVIYGIHFMAFKDMHHIAIYLIGDIAFAPLEVLIVTLILHRVLQIQEKRKMLNKLNMVIGVFFSEVGTDLVRRLSTKCLNTENLSRNLLVDAKWSDKMFATAEKEFRSTKHDIHADREQLKVLKEFLDRKRPFIMEMLGNPNLLEHEKFTDVLWSVTHLAEELAVRKDLENIPQSDHDHIEGDMKRAFNNLAPAWLRYMKHLKNDYPYLFSLATRTNPFNPNASVEVLAD